MRVDDSDVVAHDLYHRTRIVVVFKSGRVVAILEIHVAERNTVSVYQKTYVVLSERFDDGQVVSADDDVWKRSAEEIVVAEGDEIFLRRESLCRVSQIVKVDKIAVAVKILLNTQADDYVL